MGAGIGRATRRSGSSGGEESRQAAKTPSRRQEVVRDLRVRATRRMTGLERRCPKLESSPSDHAPQTLAWSWRFGGLAALLFHARFSAARATRLRPFFSLLFLIFGALFLPACAEPTTVVL